MRWLSNSQISIRRQTEPHVLPDGGGSRRQMALPSDAYIELAREASLGALAADLDVNR
jgi:hypothetical protein